MDGSRPDGGWGHRELLGGHSGVELAIPHSNDDVGGSNGQGAGEVHGVGAAQSVLRRQRSSAAFDTSGQFDWAGCCPQLLRGGERGGEPASIEVVVAAGGGKRGGTFLRPPSRITAHLRSEPRDRFPTVSRALRPIRLPRTRQTPPHDRSDRPDLVASGVAELARYTEHLIRRRVRAVPAWRPRRRWCRSVLVSRARRS
jgi:hypothetical protein